MPTFEVGAIVRVPFPYTNRGVLERRPALVVSSRDAIAGGFLLWVVMITSAENRRWPGDVGIEDDHASMGLPAPSLIRPAKIATVEAASASLLGMLDTSRLRLVMARVAAGFGLTS